MANQNAFTLFEIPQDPNVHSERLRVTLQGLHRSSGPYVHQQIPHQQPAYLSQQIPMDHLGLACAAEPLVELDTDSDDCILPRLLAGFLPPSTPPTATHIDIAITYCLVTCNAGTAYIKAPSPPLASDHQQRPTGFKSTNVNNSRHISSVEVKWQVQPTRPLLPLSHPILLLPPAKTCRLQEHRSRQQQAIPSIEVDKAGVAYSAPPSSPSPCILSNCWGKRLGFGKRDTDNNEHFPSGEVDETATAHEASSSSASPQPSSNRRQNLQASRTQILTKESRPIPSVEVDKAGTAYKAPSSCPSPVLPLTAAGFRNTNTDNNKHPVRRPAVSKDVQVSKGMDLDNDKPIPSVEPTTSYGTGPEEGSYLHWWLFS
ncbi:hypothetical protein CSUB01_11287 [Colletotrichum sublineola]|uniref:Uncharacterized protein n=1 Tax=Colletotrichum sublineola TaxID=1173701 RepID=A0A066X4A6_COLSU|nr:hypothetical protein CSUB01_11287 [Colletotrichum sublineola]